MSPCQARSSFAACTPQTIVRRMHEADFGLVLIVNQPNFIGELLEK